VGKRFHAHAGESQQELQRQVEVWTCRGSIRRRSVLAPAHAVDAAGRAEKGQVNADPPGNGGSRVL